MHSGMPFGITAKSIRSRGAELVEVRSAMCRGKNMRVLSGTNPSDYSSRRVAVAMSGGVDSSLAAILLKEAGFEVVGLTMVLWDYDRCGGAHTRGCCDLSTVNDALEVAGAAGIPHYTVNLREEFDRLVVEDFVKNYLSGRTPNPCVICNTSIKWKALLRKARSIGSDLIATGHYARIGAYPDGSFSLFTGVDSAKDQSYFLWGLRSSELAATLFPLGAMTKTETRREAARRNLRTADRSESQEICFIPDDDYGRFLRQRLGDRLPLPLTPGDFLDTSGRIIGKHRGAAFYTVGQRRGLGAALGYPAYVIRVDAGTNTITVGGREDILSRSMTVGELNWVRGFPQADTFSCEVRIRYRTRGVRAEVLVMPEGLRVIFESPQSAVTPGQSAVFYDGEEVLGGGVIISGVQE
jgi:tRNA-uridine 2-sulfurtransferase